MYLLLGTASVMIALVATRFTYQKFLPQAATDLLPQWRLGLPGLPADGFVNPNALGVTVLFIIPIALSLSQRPSLSGGAFRVAAGALSMLALGVLALTQSRASWLAVFLLAVGVTICSLHWSRSRRVVTLFLIMAAPIILLASLHYYDPDQYARLMTPKRMTSVWRRVEILSAAWAMLAESPWTGVGLNGFRRLYLSSEDLGSAEISHAHNTAVQILLDVGIPGFLAYLVFFIVVTRRGLLAWLQAPPSAVRNIAVGGLLTWLCVHLFGLTDALALGSRVGTLQWWIAGLTVTAARSARLSAAGYLDANN
jgi:O-antigen ligase